MTQVTIVFNSLLKFWDFKHVLRRKPIQASLKKRSLICLCTEEEIKLAIYAYQARVEEIK